MTIYYYAFNQIEIEVERSLWKNMSIFSHNVLYNEKKEISALNQNIKIAFNGSDPIVKSNHF